MRWERKKPLWPKVAALGLLFVLALAAPQNWRAANPGPSPTPPEAIDPWTQPELEITSAPIVIEPLSASSPSMPNAQFEPLPARREFNYDALFDLRDMVLGLLDQVPTTPPATIRSTPRPMVRVTNESDRLAMVPPRLPRTSRQPEIVASQLTPEKEVADFAAVLLEAARKPRQRASTASNHPRLAMVADKRAPAEVAPALKPQTAQLALPTAPPAIEPPPIRHRPQALIEQLEGFSAGSPGTLWSRQVLAHIEQLTKESITGRENAAEVLMQLEELYSAGLSQAANQTTPDYHNHWLQCVRSLGRRMVLWRLLLDSEQPKVIGGTSTSPHLLPTLTEVAQLLNQEENGNAWREYLLLDQIADATSEGSEAPTLIRAKLAQDVLSRMSDTRLTEAQTSFLESAAFVNLQQALRPWAAGKVNLETLAALIERYESGGELRYAVVIAQLQQRLKWSESTLLQSLAADLDQSYRSANMRIAMSNELLNRMLPKQKPIVTPVHDRIANTKVRGRARTTTQLRINLVPDTDAWHFGLEAFGKVYSDTRSDTWPARVRNAAKMQYRATKEITISERGLHTTPANATARGRNELLGVDSQLDPIPLVGLLLRDMARQKHKKSRPQALSQAKAKVARQAKQRMNSALDQKLKELEQKFRDKVLAPIEELSLLADPVQMHTTGQRAVMQLRLANSQQLAAHTVRPLAPSDSVLSIQMHESALNNAMMGLGLDGRRMTMLELFEFFAQRFGQAHTAPPADLPRGAVIEFSSRDAARVHCDEDQLKLILGVKELAHRRDKIKNFEIHIHFRPVLDGLEVKLVRDGTLQFSGRRLKTGPRVVLHSVIGKVLQKDQEISLLKPGVMADPRLARLMVTQLVLEDGWIGLALGPAHPSRTAWRADLPEVLQTPFVR